MDAAVLVLFTIILTTTVVLLVGLLANLSKKRHGTHGYTEGRSAGLGEVALDYIAHRVGVANITLVITLDRVLNPQVISVVMRRLQAKHALLRSYVSRENSSIFVKTLPFTPELPHILIEHLHGADWTCVFNNEVNTPFVPTAQCAWPYPLMRAVVISAPRNCNSQCALVLTIDHRLADGFTAATLFDELIKDYAVVARGDLQSVTVPDMPLSPPTEELGPFWLLLPRLFLKSLALILYVAVFFYRFRGFTRLPLRLHTRVPLAPSEQQQQQPPIEAEALPVLSTPPHPFLPHCDSDPSNCMPQPPPVMRGLSHISGLFRPPSAPSMDLLRVPWTTAAVFSTLTESETTRLLATCKREKVTITSALFAAMSLAIAEKEMADSNAKCPLLVYSYTLLDLRKLSRALADPIRLGLHISSIFSIAEVRSLFTEDAFWRLCKNYQDDKRSSFIFLEPWRNLLLQWLLAHAAVFISICNFYRGPGSRFVRWLGKSLPRLSPTFAISNMGSLDHFDWTESSARNANNTNEFMPLVKEVYGSASIPISWPFCLLLTSSVNNALKLNFAFSPQAVPQGVVEGLSRRVAELLRTVAAPPKA